MSYHDRHPYKRPGYDRLAYHLAPPLLLVVWIAACAVYPILIAATAVVLSAIVFAKGGH